MSHGQEGGDEGKRMQKRWKRMEIGWQTEETLCWCPPSVLQACKSPFSLAFGFSNTRVPFHLLIIFEFSFPRSTVSCPVRYSFLPLASSFILSLISHQYFAPQQLHHFHIFCLAFLEAYDIIGWKWAFVNISQSSWWITSFLKLIYWKNPIFGYFFEIFVFTNVYHASHISFLFITAIFYELLCKVASCTISAAKFYRCNFIRS